VTGAVQNVAIGSKECDTVPPDQYWLSMLLYVEGVPAVIVCSMLPTTTSQQLTLHTGKWHHVSGCGAWRHSFNGVPTVAGTQETAVGMDTCIWDNVPLVGAAMSMLAVLYAVSTAGTFCWKQDVVTLFQYL
jgi:hypothetical protein